MPQRLRRAFGPLPGQMIEGNWAIGQFRLSGLASGMYKVRVSLPARGLRPWFPGGTSNLIEAQSIRLVSGEEYKWGND
jgi:hypothetical protein